jgi:hypothetical protein
MRTCVLKNIQPIAIKRKFPVNVTDPIKPFFSRLISTQSQDVNVFHMSNVNIVAQGVVFKWLTVYNPFLLHNDRGPVVRYSIRNILRVFLLWPSIHLKKHAAYILIDNVYSHTYYHWLTEALPRLFLVREKIPSSVLLLPSNHNQKFHTDALQIFDVRQKQFLKARVRYIVPHLTASTQIGKIANYHPAVINEMVAYIKSNVNISVNYGQRIYVSRSRASKRKVLNEYEVTEYLATVGFRVVYFEDHSFSEQVSIMHHTQYVVGLHGAGLANILFMAAGGSILELRRFDNGENYFYFSLANVVNLNYLYQFCESPDAQASVQDADVVVDMSLLKLNVEKMLQG